MFLALLSGNFTQPKDREATMAAYGLSRYADYDIFSLQPIDIERLYNSHKGHMLKVNPGYDMLVSGVVLIGSYAIAAMDIIIVLVLLPGLLYQQKKD